MCMFVWRGVSGNTSQTTRADFLNIAKNLIHFQRFRLCYHGNGMSPKFSNLILFFQREGR